LNNRLKQLKRSNYTVISQADKDLYQEVAFAHYYESNGSDLVITLNKIRDLLIEYTEAEQYERCELLKDILDRFE
tara:strand:+ start:261 stop:485 length:225 start_codon:yes stop_codon:yes gene_type:complete